MAIVELYGFEIGDNGIHTMFDEGGVFGVRELTMLDCERARLLAHDHKNNEIIYNGRIHGIYSVSKMYGSTGYYYTFRVQDRRSILDPPSPYVPNHTA